MQRLHSAKGLVSRHLSQVSLRGLYTGSRIDFDLAVVRRVIPSVAALRLSKTTPWLRPAALVNLALQIPSEMLLATGMPTGLLQVETNARTKLRRLQLSVVVPQLLLPVVGSLSVNIAIRLGSR